MNKANAVMGQTVSALLDLYRAERPAYDSITTERGNKVADVLRYLIQKDQVSAWPLLKAIPEKLGLSWTGPGEPHADPQSSRALSALAAARVNKLALQSIIAADNLQKSLAQLKISHDRFASGKALTFDDLLAAVSSASKQLQDVANAR